MNSLELAQYQKVCKFVTMAKEEMKERWGWTVDEKGWGLPWDGNYVGFTITIGQKDLNSEQVAWLRRQECIAQVDEGRIILAPQVEVPLPVSCFHTTLYGNVSSILRHALLTGAEIGRSTSKRRDCEHFIYVSFSVESARSWAQAYRLGKDNAGQEWGILRIDTNGLTKRILRDPCSNDGYILEDSSVKNQFLSLAERFLP